MYHVTEQWKNVMELAKEIRDVIGCRVNILVGASFDIYLKRFC